VARVFPEWSIAARAGYQDEIARAARCAPAGVPLEDVVMLVTLAVILLVAWLLGFVAFNVGGGLIHLLLVVALIAFIFNMVSGRRSVA